MTFSTLAWLISLSLKLCLKQFRRLFLPVCYEAKAWKTVQLALLSNPTCNATEMIYRGCYHAYVRFFFRIASLLAHHLAK
jgi:hypothetical protein